MNQSELEAIEFTDKDLTIVKLHGNRNYLIDGELYTTDYKGKQLGVANVEDIRLVSFNTITKHYTDGKTTMSIQDYIANYNKLSSKYNDEDGCWHTLEDEFAYRKFVQVWQPVKEDIQVISEPIKVEIVKTVYDTGNPFIKNNFLFNGGKTKEAGLFTYYRQEAIESIVEKCFDSLGMKYEHKLDYHETKNKKVWSNSTHSGIKYLVAFGTYVFNDSWREKSNIVGTLKDCQMYYERDKKQLEDIINTNYKEHFGNFDEGTFDYKGLIDNLKRAEDHAKRIDVKRGSQGDYNLLRKYLCESLNLVIDHLSE